MKARHSIPIRIMLTCALAGMGVQAQIKVACVGNSITAALYPGKLGALLGLGYRVKSEGVSGTCMQKAGRQPYWNSSAFKDVFTFKPAIITIALGTNDSKATQWNRARYMADYKAMIDTFSTISPKPQIWLVKPMPAWYATNNSAVNPSVPGWGFENNIEGNGINGLTIRDSVGPAIEQVAKEKGLPTIDLFVPLLMGKPYEYTVTPSWARDGVHPEAIGHDTIAAVIYRALKAGPTAIFLERSQADGAFPEPRHLIGMKIWPVGLPGFEHLYSLDGKSRLRTGTPISAGAYVLRVR
ncbi:MAG: GDSL-type esterase/lipase family protein [Fibrobacteria bacterium]